MLAILSTLLTDPEQFFADRGDLGLKGPLAVVVGIVVIGVLTSLVSTVLMSQMLSGRMVQTPRQSMLMGGFSFAMAAIGRIIGPFLWWLVFAGIFYLMTALLDGEGDFDQVLAVAGWGLVPRMLTIAFSFLLAIVGAVLVSSGMSPGIASMFGALSSFVGILTTLWSGYIWGHGLASVRNVSVREGYIAAAPVVVLGILVTILSAVMALLGGIGMM